MIWGVCFKLATAHRVEMTALGLISFPNCWLLWSPDTEGGIILWHSCEVQGTEVLRWGSYGWSLTLTSPTQQGAGSVHTGKPGCFFRLTFWAMVVEFQDGSDIPKGLEPQEPSQVGKLFSDPGKGREKCLCPRQRQIRKWFLSVKWCQLCLVLESLLKVMSQTRWSRLISSYSSHMDN